MSHSEEFLEPYLPRNKQSLAINVGAHAGLWVEKFSPLFSQVLAIEANPEYAQRIRGLKFPNVEVIEAAGWIVSGQMMDFNIRDSLPMQSALACRDLLREQSISRTERIATIAIDDIPKNSCDLIFVDVEGAEIQVLQGATRTIEAYHPQLIVECHEIEHREWIRVWLSRAGYNVSTIHDPKYALSDPRWEQCAHIVAQYWQYRGTW